jgi:FkbM family methyltransferase
MWRTQQRSVQKPKTEPATLLVLPICEIFGMTKLISYSREIRFCIKECLDWQSAVSLIFNTAKFHLSNYWRIVDGPSEIVSIGLRIGSLRADLSLRPIGGDLFVLYEVLLDRCYDLPDDLICPTAVKCIVDCGANIGIASLFFASRYPNATIYSIEPHHDNFALLQKNVRKEPRIVPINAAVTDVSTKFVHISTDRPTWGNVINGSGAGSEVSGITISEILEKYGLTKVDLLKIDIEGGEKVIFKHGEFLSRIGFGVIELHGEYAFEEFASDVSKWGGRASRGGSRNCKMVTFQGSVDTARMS